MSKIKAALITAILGSSTAAMAAPGISFTAGAQVSWGTSSAPVIRDHGDRYTAPVYQAPARPTTTWISLAQPLHLENGRDMLTLNRLGSYTQIRLQAASGYSYIQKVKVRFRDGSVQNMTVNQWLSARNPMVQFDLRDNRGIESIAVMGTAHNYNASYQVFAQGNTTIQLPQRPSTPTYQWMGHSYEQPAMPSTPAQQAPVSIASELTFVGTLGFRQFPVQTPVGSHFSTLRLEGAGGPLNLSRVIVSFADGTHQEINNINRNLTPGEAVDLRLRANGQITQLVVYTNDSLTPVNSVTGSFMISAF
jgi:hypothetical protein